MRNTITTLMIAFVVLLGTGATATAQAAKEPVPQNARGLRYGSGWECNRGYVRRDSSCVAIVLPANAFLGHMGSDWECARGYVKDGKSCTPIKLPANAYLDDSGYGKCIRCGQAVPEKRLEAVPWARHCVSCQELHERGLLTDDDE